MFFGIWLFPQIGILAPKMDGENNANNGNPDFLMDDLGVPLFSETSIYVLFDFINSHI